MNRALSLIALMGLGAAAYFTFSRTAYADVFTGDTGDGGALQDFPIDATFPDWTGNTGTAEDFTQLVSLDNWDLQGNYGDSMTQADNNMIAFLYVLRLLETNNDYSVIAGGAHFDSFAEHPFILDPTRPKPLGTTASGAYQIVVGTWKDARDALHLPDFSPQSQDLAAQWLIRVRRRAGELVDAGQFDAAAQKLVKEWDALRRLYAGTYPLTVADAKQAYTQVGGELA